MISIILNTSHSRAECAKKCHENAECIGFEYYPASNRDCYLTKTPWQTVQPANTGSRWGCEKKGGKIWNFEIIFKILMLIELDYTCNFRLPHIPLCLLFSPLNLDVQVLSLHCTAPYSNQNTPWWKRSIKSKIIANVSSINYARLSLSFVQQMNENGGSNAPPLSLFGLDDRIPEILGVGILWHKKDFFYSYLSYLLEIFLIR